MKATITLKLTYKQIAKVMEFLNTLSEPHISPVNNELPDKVQVIESAVKTVVGALDEFTQPVTKPTAGKKTSMPAFGRNQEQITTYEESEEARVELLDEKAVIKAEKLAVKEATAKVANDVVDSIKEAVVAPKPIEQPLKPWLL